MTRLIAAALITFAISSTEASAQEKADLQGAWRIVQITTAGPNASTNNNPFPGYYLFTNTHYSLTRENAQPRSWKITGADTVAALRSVLRFAAQAGTYRIERNQLVFNRVVSLGPDHMGTTVTHEFRVRGDTLWIIAHVADGPYPSTTKLVREK